MAEQHQSNLKSAVADAPPPRTRLLPEIDPAFQRAVDAGLLTVKDAIQRGDREIFAMRLVRRHGIATRLAYQVADNRISLHEAVQRKPVAVVPVPAARRPAASTAQKLAVVGLAVAGLALASWNLGGRYFPERADPRTDAAARATAAPSIVQSPAEPEAAVPAVPDPAAALASTRIERDASGQIVEIEGPDPGHVLIAYCRAAQGLALQPLEITETVPRFGDARLGVFRSDESLPSPQAIWIRKDWQTRRWVAGDGRGPIVVRQAPEVPAGAFRRPVL